MFHKIKMLTLCSLLVIGVSACASTKGYKKAENTSSSMEKFNTEITNTRAQVDVALKALTDLAAAPEADLRKTFETFSKAVDRVEAHAKRVRARADKMSENGQSYFDAWRKEFVAISNPELRRRSEERLQQTIANYDSIITKMQAAKESFQPFQTDLKDIQTYLSVDLSSQGVQSLEDIIAKTQKDTVVLNKKLDEVITEISAVSAAMSPR